MFKSMVLKPMGMVLAVIISQSGCSVIGFGAGCLIDASKPDSLIMSNGQLNRAKTGRKAIVTLKNGRILQGKFAGIHHFSSPEYESMYNEFCDQISDSLYLPHYGNSVDITLTSGKTLARRFIGFDYRFDEVKFSPENKMRAAVLMESLDSGPAGKIDLSELENISGPGGKSVDRKAMEKLFSAGEMPVYSYLVIDSSDDRLVIAMDDVDRVAIHNRKYNKYYGLGIGAALDITSIIIISTMTFDFDLGNSSWGAITTCGDF